MKLFSALRHLRRKHYACWSCRIEQILVKEMISGRAWVWKTSDGWREIELWAEAQDAAE
jgi:hypothetical protein